MKRFIFLILLSLFIGGNAEFHDKTEEDFLKASVHCIKREKIPKDIEQKFENFQYPDVEIVHKFLRCVWMDLELWNDRTGFNVEHIGDLYKDKANTETLIPILSECNRNPQNDPPQKWVYRSFMCILESRVGTWFKDDVAKKIKEQGQ